MGRKKKEVAETVQADTSESPLEVSNVEMKPHFKDRLEKINEMNANHLDRYAKENPEEANEEIELDETDSINQANKAAEEENAIDAVLEKEDTQPKKKIKIDGVEKELTEDELIALAQKAGAVDARLAEATRVLEDAKRQAATRETYDVSRQPPVNPPSLADVDEEVDRIAKSLTFGDEGQVRNAVKDILTRGRSISPDVDKSLIHANVTAAISFERGKQILESTPEQGGYSDVWSDPVLKSRFQQREHELRSANDNRPHPELYKSIGDEIRQWRDNLIKNFTKTGFENREELKRDTGIVRGAGGKLATSPMGIKPQSHDDILNYMRAGRGQH